MQLAVATLAVGSRGKLVLHFPAAAYLDLAEYDFGNHMEDLRAQSLIRQKVHNSELQAACALPFDEVEL
ncbi:hypothetical protein Tco_0936673 [Tanacetum coccineum]|uniref:Uncharacterized protein n=1 Tax=Tanacetum coccineum TaxID=301880 RepID=A0ABQ5DET7_9ASTR